MAAREHSRVSVRSYALRAGFIKKRERAGEWENLKQSRKEKFAESRATTIAGSASRARATLREGE